MIKQKFLSKKDNNDYERIIIDETNTILLKKNNERTYISHMKKENGVDVVINTWSIKGYRFDYLHKECILKEYNLLCVQNGHGGYDALYNYQTGKFIIEKGIWGFIDTRYLKEYGVFIASVAITSDSETDDIIKYINPLTHTEETYEFIERSANYYAFININGDIIENKIFSGQSITRISSIIDLDEYESLQEYFQEQKEKCNRTKNQQKQAYLNMIKKRTYKDISPFLDEEVMRLIKK